MAHFEKIPTKQPPRPDWKEVKPGMIILWEGEPHLRVQYGVYIDSDNENRNETIKAVNLLTGVVITSDSIMEGFEHLQEGDCFDIIFPSKK